MKCILIADSGSTKTDWALLVARRKTLCQFTTEGINPVTATDEQIKITLGIAFSYLENPTSIDKVCFYGAGCATTEICENMAALISETFGCSDIYVYSDLLGAARSLLGDSPGIACILGTGSNSCFYDGCEVVKNIPSLGFILGDEGSGNALGKRLLSDSLKSLLPDELQISLREEYLLEKGEVLKKVYKEPKANAYLASFVPFIANNIEHPYLRKLVSEEFAKFLDRNVMAYHDCEKYDISFAGGIASLFADILRVETEKRGFNVLKIIKSPIEGLIEYHINHQ